MAGEFDTTRELRSLMFERLCEIAHDLHETSLKRETRARLNATLVTAMAHLVDPEYTAEAEARDSVPRPHEVVAQ